MQQLQVVGISIALLTFVYGLWKFKRRRYSRLQFAIASFFAASLLAIVLQPMLGELISRPIQMQLWNVILFGVCVVLFGLFLYSMNMTNANRRAISRLIRAIATRDFEQEHADEPIGEMLVVIPAYNEEANIGHVLRRMPKEVSGLKVTTLVVVDGATDRTAEAARKNGATVVENPIQRGGGAAVHAGYQIAMRTGVKIVVTLDADGQHQPEEIPSLVAPILDGSADFVNGSRILGDHEWDSRLRLCGIYFFNWVISALMFSRITDSSNSFRAIATEHLYGLNLYQDQFYTSEILIESMKNGVRVVERPITIKRRLSGESKKGPSWRYGWGFTKAILLAWIR